MSTAQKPDSLSINLFQEKMMENLMDSSKASVEFKAQHRRSNSTGNPLGTIQSMSKLGTYPPKPKSSSSSGLAANFSSPSTPPKSTSSQHSIDGSPQPPSLIVDSPPPHGTVPRNSLSPQMQHHPVPRHLSLTQSKSTSDINYAYGARDRRKSDEIAATATHTSPRRQCPPLGLKSLTLGDKPPNQSPTNKKGFKPISFKMPSAQPNSNHMKQDEELEEMVAKTSSISLNSSADIIKKEKIGQGVSGHVFKVQHGATGKWMAAKCMMWTDSTGERQRIIRDLEVMTKHRSPYIVQYFGSDIVQKEVWVFMELMDTCLGKLLTRLKPNPFPEDVIGKVVIAVVTALDYLKTNFSVIHRDVKPSNILLDRSGRVKLCDFGISGRLVDSKAHTRDAGCVGYMAPERIRLTNIEKGYDIRADVWSLGISLVELSTAKFPYAHLSNDFQVLTSIVNDDPPVPKDTRLSLELISFISSCLTKDHEKRPSFKELLDTRFVKRYDKMTVNIASWYHQVTTFCDNT